MTLSYIPNDAPFSGDQRAWLSGFMAAMRTRLIAAELQTRSADNAPGLHIFYGTQTGNSEMVAGDAAAAAKAAGFAPVVRGLDEIEVAEFVELAHVLVVCSTYGEGDMPDNAELFWEALNFSEAPRAEHMHFAVIALGDSSYDGYCQAGKSIDVRLEQLGAGRVLPRLDCDVDYETAAAEYIAELIPRYAAIVGDMAEVPAGAVTAAAVKPKAGPQWNRKHPFPALLKVNRLLSQANSAKEIRHFEFDLADSNLAYEAGDALGVMPRNDPALVETLLRTVGIDPATPVSAAGGALPTALDGMAVGELLWDHYEISTPSRDLLNLVESQAGDEELSHVLENHDKEPLEAWLWGRDIVDILALLPAGALELEELLAVLRPLQHRAYSISSSALEHPDAIHLTVAAVRFERLERRYGGVASTFLAERLSAPDKAGIFLQPNRAFRVPADGDLPMIMVGPGTGIAPFRAFLQERRASGAKGQNWLFFGDQRRSTDFIYEHELSEMSRQGVLNRLDLAFSRDQAAKLYVQHRMRENGAELYRWLEEGGHFYVCGDASRMAKDVDRALHDVVGEHGGLNPDGAAEYVNNLKKERRYLRDVY